MRGWKAEKHFGRRRVAEALVRTETEVEEQRRFEAPLEIITVKGQP